MCKNKKPDRVKPDSDTVHRKAETKKKTGIALIVVCTYVLILLLSPWATHQARHRSVTAGLPKEQSSDSTEERIIVLEDKIDRLEKRVKTIEEKFILASSSDTVLGQDSNIFDSLLGNRILYAKGLSMRRWSPEVDKDTENQTYQDGICFVWKPTDQGTDRVFFQIPDELDQVGMDLKLVLLEDMKGKDDHVRITIRSGNTELFSADYSEILELPEENIVFQIEFDRDQLLTIEVTRDNSRQELHMALVQVDKEGINPDIGGE